MGKMTRVHLGLSTVRFVTIQLPLVHCWLLPPLQVYVMIAAELAVEAPDTSRHSPLARASMFT